MGRGEGSSWGRIFALAQLGAALVGTACGATTRSGDGSTDAGGSGGSGAGGTGGVGSTACPHELRQKVRTAELLIDSLQGFTNVSVRPLGVACANIATDLGASGIPDVGDGTNISDAELEAACAAASEAIRAELSIAEGLAVAVEGGACSIAVETTLQCEPICDPASTCPRDSIAERCEPGGLSVACGNECAGGSTCEGSSAVLANCSGDCRGVCVGSCAGICHGECAGTCSLLDTDGKCGGTCSGTCSGLCDGRCEGACSGDCLLGADVNLNCGPEAHCRGTCSGFAVDAECRTSLAPPSCDLDADCYTLCHALAPLGAQCPPPRVVVVRGGSPVLVATLEANLPAVLVASASSGLAVRPVADAISALSAVVTQIVSSVSCTAELGASFPSEVSRSAAASARLSVVLRASADVLASAGL